MIFPRECKEVGYADTEPCGRRVYFLSRYLVHKTASGHEIIRVMTDPEEKGLMRKVVAEEVVAPDPDVYWYPGRVNLSNRAGLIGLAMGSGHRCTIFSGDDEHLTFVLDPDLSGLLPVHLYDVRPPLPSLSARVAELESAGMFGDLDIRFIHHVTDISAINADIYPCRASGYSRTLDADPLLGGETIAGCRAASGVCRECYGDGFNLVDICPVETVMEEPFITRCCQKERGGTGIYNGKFGAVVHWGASPVEIFRSVEEIAAAWRSRTWQR